MIGAGRAGAAAAEEAALRLDGVTLVDGLESPSPDWGVWPELIFRGPSCAGPVHRGREAVAGVTCEFGVRVAAVRRGSATTADGRRLSADAFVLATGSGFEPVAVEGRTKLGVTTLDSPAKYRELGRSLDALEVAVVSGEGSRGLQVAERLAEAGVRVALLISSWQRGPPGPSTMEVLFEAAERAGVSVTAGVAERALGPGRTEAVLAAGRVIPSDALVVVPRRTPSPVPSPVAVGPRGGVSVGSDMRTNLPGIFAAGGCAEVCGGLPFDSVLDGAPVASGRVAGANAAGSHVSIRVPPPSTFAVFGLRWTRLGTTKPGPGLREVSGRQGESSACSMVYDRVSGAVLGLEVVGDLGRSGWIVPPVGPRATLRALAYGAEGSSDISVISETARLGLRAWSGS